MSGRSSKTGPRNQQSFVLKAVPLKKFLFCFLNSRLIKEARAETNSTLDHVVTVRGYCASRVNCFGSDKRKIGKPGSAIRALAAWNQSQSLVLASGRLLEVAPRYSHDARGHCTDQIDGLRPRALSDRTCATA